MGFFFKSCELKFSKEKDPLKMQRVIWQGVCVFILCVCMHAHLKGESRAQGERMEREMKLAVSINSLLGTALICLSCLFVIPAIAATITITKSTTFTPQVVKKQLLILVQISY